MPNTPCNICTIREGVGWLNFKITSCRLTEKPSAYAFPWLDFWDNMTGFTITPLHFIMATSILLISHKLRCHYTHYAKYNKIRVVVITLFSENLIDINLLGMAYFAGLGLCDTIKLTLFNSDSVV